MKHCVGIRGMYIKLGRAQPKKGESFKYMSTVKVHISEVFLF